MSAQLQWLITRDTSSFIVKKRNVKQPFSTVSLSSLVFAFYLVIMMLFTKIADNNAENLEL